VGCPIHLYFAFAGISPPILYANEQPLATSFFRFDLSYLAQKSCPDFNPDFGIKIAPIFIKIYQILCFSRASKRASNAVFTRNPGTLTNVCQTSDSQFHISLLWGRFFCDEDVHFATRSVPLQRGVSLCNEECPSVTFFPFLINSNNDTIGTSKTQLTFQGFTSILF